MSVDGQTTNPYPGLRPFEIEEDYLFFGRDGQSEQILERLRRNRFVAVVGTSGSGKSSLIRAGLLPYLFGGFMAGAGSHWRIAVMRPGGDPIRNLARELNDPSILGDPAASQEDAQQNATLLEVTLRRSGLGLIEAIRQARLPDIDNVLIVVDQFEELFRFAEPTASIRREDDAAAFVKLLLESVQGDLPIYVVLTMRSDFIGDCARYRDLPEAVTAGLYLIPRMTRDQRREAIERPAQVAGSEISRRLVNRLLNDGGDNPDQLPILQHSLMRTWDYWARHRESGQPVDLDDYKAIGEMAEALSLHAEEAYAELPSDRYREIAKRLFQALTEKGDDNREIRRPTVVSTVAAIANATVAEVIEVIEYFRKPGRSFLTPAAGIPLTGDTMIDISHESLIRGWTRLVGWVNEERESAEVYQRLAETAALYTQERAGLWSGRDLSYALKWRDKEKPNAEWGMCYHPGFAAAMKFLDRSAAAQFHSRLATAGIAAVTVVCLGLLGFSLYRSSVNRAAWEAKSEAEATAKIKLVQSRDLDAMQLVKAQAEAKAQIDKAQEEEKIKDADNKFLQSQQETEWVRDVARTGEAARIASESSVGTLISRLNDAVPINQKISVEMDRADALTRTGQHEEAAKVYTAVLRLHPEQREIQASRGYEYILLGRAEDARIDFSAYLETNPDDYLQRLNLAIALAMLKRYDEAIAQTELSIQNFKFSSSGLYDSEVSPDIERATGQKIINAAPVTFYVALFYEVANLRAFAGDPGFEKALARADRVAREQGFRVPESGTTANGSTGSVDPFILAIEWAWLDARASIGRSDYGVYAAYGALWERAGRVQPRFKDWGGHFYGKFQTIHSAQRERRYDDLSSWVNGRARKLYPESGKAPEIPAEDKANPSVLQIQANMLESQENNKGAADALSDAINQIEHQPQGHAQIVSLLLQRAWIYRKLNEIKLAREDYQRVIRLQPQTALAHFYLGFSDPNSDPVVQQKEYELAIQYDPQLTWAKTRLAMLIQKKDPKRAIALLKEANQIGTPDASTYQELAEVQNAIGDYSDALVSINEAIALSPEASESYDIRDEAEKGLGRDPVERALDKAASYRRLADYMARTGNTNGALTIYLRALRGLAVNTASNENDSVQAEEAVEMHDISQMLEGLSSHEDAKQFWLSVSSKPYLKPVEKIVQQEIKRLSAP
jgi:tetratricopeptide (TPR) repeat protein